MPAYLCLSIRFLDPYFHGRRDGGEPEWPPSPLRLFQALVAVAAARWGERQQPGPAGPALDWLAAQPPPVILAPPGATAAAYRLSVPNNAMDLVARAWSRGNTSNTGDASPAKHRTMKTVRPTRFADNEAVHYLWELPAPLPDEARGYLDILAATARNLVTLGWGVDLVAGHGQVLDQDAADRLPGQRWRPTCEPAAEGLRVPTPGTLEALAGRHQAFLGRLDGNQFTPVPALTAFAVVGYRRDTDTPARPVAAFELLHPAERLATLPAGRSRYRPFDPVRYTHVVAARTRHAARAAAQVGRRPPAWVEGFILGHGPGKQGQAVGAPDSPRFAYLPLPSIEDRGRPGEARRRAVGSIRRLLLAEPPGGPPEPIRWARRALSGRELIDEGSHRAVALLSLISEHDRNVQPYLRPASVWSTVTPVVLPGHDDRDTDKALELLRRAIGQAGFSRTLADGAVLEWRRVGFLAGLDLAPRYRCPAYLQDYTRYHVRIRWRDARGQPVPVRGPLVLGAGRYCGLGLFVSEDGEV
jgi:CRISPR-associated protein Csb2